MKFTFDSLKNIVDFIADLIDLIDAVFDEISC